MVYEGIGSALRRRKGGSGKGRHVVWGSVGKVCVYGGCVVGGVCGVCGGGCVGCGVGKWVVGVVCMCGVVNTIGRQNGGTEPANQEIIKKITAHAWNHRIPMCWNEKELGMFMPGSVWAKGNGMCKKEQMWGTVFFKVVCVYKAVWATIKGGM